jgi:hypothetical protein
MYWAYDYDEEDKKRIHNSGREISWKTTWRAERDIEG